MPLPEGRPRSPMRAYPTAPQGLASRWAHALVQGLDRLGVDAARVLTERSLWGYLPRRTPVRPGGPPRLALSFDLDYQADTDALPALLDLVARVGARSTLFAVGRLVAADPDPYRAAVAAGHEIGNHTWSHPDNPVLNPDREFWHLTVDEMTEEIGRAQDVFERMLGVRPVGFRTPHFKDAFRMMEAMARFPELSYVSTALASKAPLPVPYFPTRTPFLGDLSLHFAAEPGGHFPQLMIPLTPAPGARWSPFCSYLSIRRPSDPSRGAGLHTLEEFAARWRRMLMRARGDGFASVYFDPLDVMRDAQTATVFEEMLREAVGEGWVLTSLAEVERVWRPCLRQDPLTNRAAR